MAEPEWWDRARRLRWKSVWLPNPGKWGKVKRSFREIGEIVGMHPKSVQYALRPVQRERRNKRLRETGRNREEWFKRKLRDTSTELPRASPLRRDSHA